MSVPEWCHGHLAESDRIQQRSSVCFQRSRRLRSIPAPGIGSLRSPRAADCRERRGLVEEAGDAHTRKLRASLASSRHRFHLLPRRRLGLRQHPARDRLVLPRICYVGYTQKGGTAVPASTTAFSERQNVAQDEDGLLKRYQIYDKNGTSTNFGRLYTLSVASPVEIESVDLVVVTATISVHPLFSGQSGIVGPHEVAVFWVDQRL